MEIILSVLFLVCIWGYFKAQDVKATNYRNSRLGQIDYGKMNEDRLLNNLSNSQVNQNTLNGKYDKPAPKKNDTWEDFKKRHPHGSWN